jgi:hypothetical protein
VQLPRQQARHREQHVRGNSATAAASAVRCS